MKKRLYVGNVNYDADDNDLRDHFKQWGQVTDAKVMMNHVEKTSRGFGFVEMATEADAKVAIAEGEGSELLGRRITVSYAKERKGAPDHA